MSYSKLYSIRSLILRYANIVGPRSNHGVIIDFVNKLRKNPNELEILGDGSQKKSYLHVYDAVDATYIYLTSLRNPIKIMIFITWVMKTGLPSRRLRI